MQQLKRARNRELMTPHTRSLIYRSCHSPGDKWKGTRRGVKVEIMYSSQPTLEGERVTWRARINREWRAGASQSIREAIETIEHEASR